jgi:hypothetical protein
MVQSTSGLLWNGPNGHAPAAVIIFRSRLRMGAKADYLNHPTIEPTATRRTSAAGKQ